MKQISFSAASRYFLRPLPVDQPIIRCVGLQPLTSTHEEDMLRMHNVMLA